MSDDKCEDVFDVDRVRELAELMIEHDLSELDLRQHGQTLRIRRGAETAIAAQPVVTSMPSSAKPSSSAPAAEADADADLVIIKSPMVGTYYSRPNPESESFLKVGQDISATTTVCIIEAMKVFNEIAAEVSGTVVAILVDDEEPVEFGKPLFKVRPRG